MSDLPGTRRRVGPSNAELAYLQLGLNQPGRKLPLFDRDGQAFRADVIRTCINRGWAEQWFSNPLAPDWLVCRLTERGVAAAVGARRSATLDDDTGAASHLA